MSVLALLKEVGPNGYGYATTAAEVTEGLDLRDKTYLLTGSNSGLGFETLRTLHARGAHVIATARSHEKAAAACIGLPQTTPLGCELSEMSSIRGCIRRLMRLGRPLDGIICNAGIMNLPELRQKHGYELQFLTNHIGHFALVTELLGLLSDHARVVVVSSSYHDSKAPQDGIEFDNLSGRRNYDGWRAYGQSKLANVLFARSLARRLGPGQTANALHPGVVDTGLSRYMNPLIKVPLAVGSLLFLKNAQQGAATQCYLACHPSVQGVSGKYFADCNEAQASALSQDRSLAERLWSTSETITTRLSRNQVGTGEAAFSHALVGASNAARRSD